MSNDSTERAKLRNTLLKNGYRPIPLLDKGARIKGWSRDDITQEWLDKYNRSAKFANTGIRCDDLAAFDIDILDEDLAVEADGLIESVCGPTKLWRIGNYPKRLLLYRMNGEAPKSCRTGKYDGHMVELLCNHGRQFAAFGMHPSGVSYKWEDMSPLNTPYSDLPAVTPNQAMQAMNALEQLFINHGLQRSTPASAQGLAGMNEFDLTDDFECQVDGQIVPWGDLKAILDGQGVFGNIRRENGEFGDSGSIHFYVAAGSGQPCAYDFVRDCCHWEAPVNQQMQVSLPDPPNQDIFTPDPLKELLNGWVMMRDNTVRRVDAPHREYPFSGFRLSMAHQQVPAPSRVNPNKTIDAVEAWKRHPDTLRADYAALKPDAPGELLVQCGSEVLLNVYQAPEHERQGGETDTVMEFIEHLIPDAREREIFWDWTAWKVAYPEKRLHGLVMVTESFGTGRGTWLKILAALIGEQYVCEVPLSMITGSNNQSAYNDFMIDSLVVSIPEALEETETQTRWQSRHLAYERIKEVIDPESNRLQVRRKYGRNGPAWCYASLVICSNHDDALAIPPGDRRLMVLENTRVPLEDAPNDLMDRIHAWKREACNVDALYQYLIERAQSGMKYQPVGKPPETAAKNRMIEAGQSDLDGLFDYMAATFKGDLISFQQWKAFVHKHRLSGDYDLPNASKMDRALTVVLRKRGRQLDWLDGRQIRIGKSRIRPWAIRHFDRWKVSHQNHQIEEEIVKNGDPGGSILEFPK